LVRSSSRVGENFSVTGFRRVRGVRLIVGEHDEALPCGVVAPDTGVVRAAEPVIRGIEEPLEHHWVRHAGEVPLRVLVRSGGWQLAGGAVVRHVVGGGGEVPSHWDAAAGTALVRRHVDASGRGVRHCGSAQDEWDPRPEKRTPRQSGCCHASDRVALRGDAHAARRRSVHACREH
jgi:hypothetical protein